MTKAGIKSAIGSFLSIVVNITKVRQSTDALVDQFYNESITQTGASDDAVLLKYDSNSSYSANLTKTGRVTVVNGTITNNTPGTALNPRFATFKDTEYYPQESNADGSTYVARGSAVNLSTGQRINLIITGNVFRVTGSMPSGTFYIEDFPYNVKD